MKAVQYEVGSLRGVEVNALGCNIIKSEFELKSLRGCPRGVIVKTKDCGIVVSEFDLQSRYYVHIRTNTYGLNSTTTVLLEGCLWH